MTAIAEHALQPMAAPRPLIDPEKQLEWVNGQVVVKEPGGARHSRLCTRLTANLGLYVEEHRLGAVYGPDATFTIGQNQRLPDVWLVSPQFQTVTIYDAPTKFTLLQAGEELTSPVLLPGFQCPVTALFQPISAHGQAPTNLAQECP